MLVSTEARRPLYARSGWFEPTLALSVFALQVSTIAADGPRPAFLWVLDVLACLGAGLSGYRPAIGVALLAVGLLGQFAGAPAETGMSGFAALTGIFAAVRIRYRHWVPIATGLAVVAFLLLVFHAPTVWGQMAASAALYCVSLVLTVGGANLWRGAVLRVRQERELAEQRSEARRLALARDLHDSVAQSLSHAAMRAHMALGEPDLQPAVRDQLERIAGECSSAAQDLRQLLSTLREGQSLDPDRGLLIDDEHLAGAVEQQRQRLCAAGLHADVRLEQRHMSAARATTIAKITVEAVTNMIRHGVPGSKCSIRIAEVDGHVRATYSNLTTRTPRPAGLGLLGVQERAALLKGRCSVTFEDGVWTLTVTLPPGYESREEALLDRHTIA
ncbi:hypothetical protein BW730_07360 [Tessaracoccus aquimaris]|uniref:histidine kinase n=1 Tax=Tessaracoccus aquimaris TaxID=1332264 RepID=A0A1Q2CMR3_9ACTN|nr:hypothetical protein BW730_07360 [Tessaracoccus aquimaris]